MIRCQICKKLFRQITWIHLRTHGITIEEYKKKFNVEYTQCRLMRKRRGKGSSGYTWKWTEEQKKKIEGNKNAEGYKNVLGCRWKRTEESNKKQSIRMKKMYEDGTLIPGSGGRCKLYKVENYIGEEVKVQGKLEVRFVGLLNKLGIRWWKPKKKIYELDGKEHYYFCDFWLPDKRLYIEVKSKYYYNLYKEEVKAKKRMMVERGKRKGFRYKIMFLKGIKFMEEQLN